MVETARTSSIALIEGATEFNEKPASATGELGVHGTALVLDGSNLHIVLIALSLSSEHRKLLRQRHLHRLIAYCKILIQRKETSSGN
jgi:hypothetical protein